MSLASLEGKKTVVNGNSWGETPALDSKAFNCLSVNSAVGVFPPEAVNSVLGKLQTGVVDAFPGCSFVIPGMSSSFSVVKTSRLSIF